MKAVEILKLLREALKMMSDNGLRLDDWRYVEMYADYVRMKRDGEKYWYIIAELSRLYEVSESTVIRIIRRLGMECQLLTP